MKQNSFCLFLVFVFSMWGCVDDTINEDFKEEVFQEVDVKYSGLDFVNVVKDTDSLNILDYLYYYNGGGLAVADFNNDGLEDIYFVSNLYSNKLYLNKGNLKFEDITKQARIEGKGTWKTGVTVVDINADGWLDIYLSVVNDNVQFKGHNQLFINNQNLTFTEMSKDYGLDFLGYSTQAAFFDYDKDGDLDCYILTHSVHNNESYGHEQIRQITSEKSGDHLLENRNGKFIDITEKVGIDKTAIGYGLGLAIADFNNDGWEDIYVSNDFFENDYYYLNQRNGMFQEALKTSFGHTSYFSMGNTVMDLDKNGYMDILTTDMLPDSLYYLKSTVTDEGLDQYLLKYNMGYYYQCSKNAMQLNVGGGKKFVDASLYFGLSATDWTWSPLAEDFNMDGMVDFFFATGIQKRLNDIDYIKFVEHPKVSIHLQKERNKYNLDLIRQMPEGGVNNYLFLSNAQGKYSNQSKWNGMKDKTYSSGAVAVDLDNDGDLDIITNNSNAFPSLYENICTQKRYFNFTFRFEKKNPFAIGTQIFFKTNKGVVKKEIKTSNAFQSNQSLKVQFSLGKDEELLDILILWPNLHIQKLETKNLKRENIITYILSKTFKVDVPIKTYIDNFIHRDKNKGFENWNAQLLAKVITNDKIDFNLNFLLPHIYSKYTPPIVVSDFNGDGLEDIFLGTISQKEERKMFFQTPKGTFQKTSFIYQSVNVQDVFVDGYALAEDIDNDGDKDIIIGSLKYPHLTNKQKTIHRIYLNLGKGTFKEMYLPETLEGVNFILPIHKKNEPFPDLLFANHIDLQHYDKSTGIYLIHNKNGIEFSIKDVKEYSSLYHSRYVTGGINTDIDGDGNDDIIIISEWGIPKVYLAKEHFKTIHTLNGLEHTFGLWQSINVMDINQDNKSEFILGNWGVNNKYGVTAQTPLYLYNDDLDKNGKKDILVSYAFYDKYYPFQTKMTLENELPYLKKEYLSYRKMASKTTEEIFKGRLNASERLSANFLESIVYNHKKAKEGVMSFPYQLQLAPIKKVLMIDKNKDNTTLLVNGNLVGVNPYEGRYDAMGLIQISYSLKEKQFQQPVYIIHPLLNGKELTDVFSVQTANAKKIVVMTHEGELLILEKNIHL